MKKLIVLTVVFAMLFCMSSCSVKDINPTYVYQCLKTQVSYESELSDESRVAEMFFPGLPEGTSITMHRASDAHYADELALIVCVDEQAAQAAYESVQTHIEEIYNDYSKYNPSQLDKIDNTIVKLYKNCVFLCVTGDYLNAEKVLENAIENSPSYFEVSSEQSSSEETVVDTSSESIESSGPIQEAQTDAKYPSIISLSGEKTEYPSGVLRVDDAAYEPYHYVESSAKNYTALINIVAQHLDGISQVYALPVPTGYGIVLPDDIRQNITYYNSQDKAISKLEGFFDECIRVVDCHDNLMKHRDEYIYFRTDHHWTQLGAYYAYESFCQTKGIDHVPLEGREVSEFDGFLGSFYWQSSNRDEILAQNPDTVVAYHPVSEKASMTFTDTNGQTYSWEIISDVNNYPVSEKYSTFAASDSPFSVLINPEIKDGSSCIIIKESYGNAFVPFLVDHYATVYEIDYRYWTGNLIDFAKEKQADDVIFINNMSMTRSSYLIAKLATIIQK